MKNLILLLATACIAIIKGQAQNSESAQNFEDRKAHVIEILKKNVDNGMPGAAIAFYSKKQGEWLHSEGYSNIEKEELLKDSQMHYLQSVSKLYMATAIFKLAEDLELNIYDDISMHLDKKTIGQLASKGITIKMLLNHTSGIKDYATEPEFVSFVIANPSKPFKVRKCINIIKDLPLNFEPGTDYAYSNTNYTLLSMIADKITGDHVRYMQKKIFEPIGLINTVYLTKENYKSTTNIVDSYWDVLNIEKPANITAIQKVNVASLRGDDGIVCTTADAIKFMKALMEGKILQLKTVEYMQEWVVKDNQKRYGFGLAYYDLGVTYAIGHSGGGIGAGCVLMYLPELDTYVFLATNFTTLIDSKISHKCSGIQTDLLKALFL